MPQGSSWTQWQQPWSQKKERKDAKDKSKGKGNGTASAPKPSFPAYDSGGSSYASSGKANVSSEEMLKAALQEIVVKNQLAVPDQFKGLLKDNLATSLTADQKVINQKRKLLSRLERLRGAQQRKAEQFENFKKELREHLAKEQSRFDKETLEITQALEETQSTLDRLLKGDVEDTMEESMEADEFELWVQENKEDSKKDPKLDGLSAAPTRDPAMEDALRMTQENQKLLAQQMHDMQAQMSYMVNALRTPMANTAPAPFSPANVVSSPDSATKQRRRALEPFARTNRSEPYTTPKETPTSLESLDGTSWREGVFVIWCKVTSMATMDRFHLLGLHVTMSLPSSTTRTWR